MKRFLRGVLAVLERKFPDKVVITQRQFDALETAVLTTNQTIADFQSRVVKLEFEVNKFNVAMGFGNTRGNSVVGSFGLER